MGYESAPEKSFDQKKTEYFSKISLRVLSAMRLHKKQGKLWEKNKNGERDWGNVSEHCLVEVARFKILAEKLALSPEVKNSGELGVALHDFDKRNEKLAINQSLNQGGSGMEASSEMDKIGEQQLRDAGFGEDIIRLASCVGGKPEQLFGIVDLLKNAELSDREIATLAVHYIDGYTRDSRWVEPAMAAEEGSVLNEVDRRTRKNLENPAYCKLDQEYIHFFEASSMLRGRGSIENEGIVCHKIEERLASIIISRTGEKIEPLELPEAIDAEIKKEIERGGS